MATAPTPLVQDEHRTAPKQPNPPTNQKNITQSTPANGSLKHKPTKQDRRLADRWANKQAGKGSKDLAVATYQNIPHRRQQNRNHHHPNPNDAAAASTWDEHAPPLWSTRVHAVVYL